MEKVVYRDVAAPTEKESSPLLMAAMFVYIQIKAEKALAPRPRLKAAIHEIDF